MASRFQLANSIREASLGDSIMADIEASIKSSDSASRGKGAVTAARYLADTDDKISTMKRRALGARTDAGIAPKEDNFVVDKLSGLARDWMTSMMGDADDTEVDNQERLSSLISEEAAKPLDDNTSPKERFLRTGKAPIDVLDVPYVESGIRDDAPITYSGDQEAGASGRTAAIDAALREALGEDEKEGPLSPDDMAITKANTDFPSRIGMDLNDNTDGKPKGLMSKPYDADRMKDVNITADTGNTIIASSYLKDNSIAENGVFSQAALETSVSNTTDNNTYNAMILGNIVKETGALTADGPKTETGYGRLTGAELAKDRRTKGRGTGPEATARNAAYIALDSNPAFTNPNTGSREGDRAVKDAMIFDIWYDDDHREAGLKLGNTQPRDGSLFKGRGLLQITGRDNYKKVQDQLAKSGIEVDLMANPEYVLDDKYALAVAIAFLEVTPEKGINKNNINELGPYKMSRLINAGEGSTAALSRWSEITGRLTGTDAQNATDANEKTAQTKAGITGDDVDGNIGPASVRAFKAYLVAQGITIPKGASKYDLVRLVNQA